MLFKEIDELTKELQKPSAKSWPSTIALVVKEDFMRGVALYEVMETLPSLLTGKAQKKISCENLTHSDLAGFFEQDDLWEQERLLLLNNCEKITAKLAHQLFNYLAQQGAKRGNRTILVGSSLPQFYQTLPNNNFFLDLPSKKPWESQSQIENWVRKNSIQAGLKLSHEQIKELVNNSCADFTQYLQELEKIKLLASPQGKVSGEAFCDLLSLNDSTTPWHLSEALMQKNSLEIAQLLFSSEAMQEEESLSLGKVILLRNAVQRQWLISSEASLGLSHDEISKRHPKLKGYALQKSLESAGKYSLRKLKSLVEKLDQLEWQLKDNAFSLPSRLFFTKLLL